MAGLLRSGTYVSTHLRPMSRLITAMELGGLEPPTSWARSKTLNAQMWPFCRQFRAPNGNPQGRKSSAICGISQEFWHVAAFTSQKPLTAIQAGRPGAARSLARFLASDNGDRVFRLPAESSGPGRRKRGYRNSSRAGVSRVSPETTASTRKRARSTATRRPRWRCLPPARPGHRWTALRPGGSRAAGCGWTERSRGSACVA
jgi:hypothetical protein